MSTKALLSTALFFATVPKVSNFFVLARLLNIPFDGIFNVLQPMLLLIIILSLVWGSINALQQQNISRFLALSSVNHFGFMLVGLLVHTQQGINASFFYLIIYICLTFGAWTSLIVVRYVVFVNQNVETRHLTKLLQLSGLLKTNPGLTLFMFINLLSMAGIPPLAGFTSKAAIFLVLLQKFEPFFDDKFFYEPRPVVSFTLLLIIIVLSSVLSVYYYIRLAKLLFFVPRHAEKPLMYRAEEEPFTYVILGSVLLFNLGAFLFFV